MVTIHAISQRLDYDAVWCIHYNFHDLLLMSLRKLLKLRMMKFSAVICLSYLCVQAVCTNSSYPSQMNWVHVRAADNGMGTAWIDSMHAVKDERWTSNCAFYSVTIHVRQSCCLAAVPGSIIALLCWRVVKDNTQLNHPSLATRCSNFIWQLHPRCLSGGCTDKSQEHSAH
jgi:hypothetical protein